MHTVTWYRKSTKEWVVETEGSINGTSFNIRFPSRFKWFAMLKHVIFIDRTIKVVCE